MPVQNVYGLILRILGKCDLKKGLADLLIRQRREHLSADPTSLALVAPPIFVPMAPAPPLASSQLTYEGLIKYVVGIRNDHVDVDASLIPGRKREYGRSPRHTHFFFRRPKSRSPGGPREPNTATSTPSTSAKRKYLLSSNTDPLYTRLRDLNFFAVSERLHLMATRLNASRELRSFGPGPYIWQHGQQTRSGKRTSCGKQR
ncbi:unnamed protein product [Tilletia laevis]|nr:unnamed protein product [Tilletia laevis]